MNTEEELKSLGLNSLAIAQIVRAQERHIGEIHGVNKITDMSYNGIGEAITVELTCTKCGAVRTRDFRHGRNKWAELAKTCSCQKRTLTEKEIAVRKTYNSNPEYIGKIYGNQRVVEILSGKPTKWLCECTECGKTATKDPSVVKRGDGQCKCFSQSEASKYIGMVFGRLTVQSSYVPKGGRRRFVCQCSCGNSYDGDAKSVIKGKVMSCGCLLNELRENAVTHDPLYSTWQAMRQRCKNESSPSYKDYGGRGISVCEEWNDFSTFRDWAIENGYRPNCGMSLDRIDVNGNYEPSNCRYTTVFTQVVNQRPRKPYKPRKGAFTINGITKSKKEWCEEYGIWAATVDYRVKHMGMTFEEALTAEKQCVGNHNPVRKQGRAKDGTRLEDLNKINSYIECNLYMAFCRLTDEYILSPQITIGNYRVDFLVDGTMIVVECDGYDQHKTKEQMSSDYKRERYLIAHGYTVIRFTGSEINGDPDGCAGELLELIQKLDGGDECQELQPTRRIM